MPQAAREMVTALAVVIQRNTRTGETWRSAIAPKSNGEMSAAMAVVANAKERIPAKPCAFNTLLRGTVHIPIAMACTKNMATNSPYSDQ
jgi:hypothetical protein